jgi:hypothetical protein
MLLSFSVDTRGTEADDECGGDGSEDAAEHPAEDVVETGAHSVTVSVDRTAR